MEEHGKNNETSLKHIGIATAIALAVALVILFTIVLPAEYDRDPLGTGGLLGLTQLAEGGEAVPIIEQFTTHKTDYAEFVLEPFQSLEYKYLMDQDTAMLYSWQADGDVYFDMHADPAGNLAEDEESYASGEGREANGVYQARFNGMHGWFWENRGFEDITIRLHTAGFYINSTVFQDGGTFEREPETALPSAGQ